MRRISTSLLAFFCFAGVSQHASAQIEGTCSVSMTPPAGITFTAPRAVNEAQGFTTSTAGATVGVFQPGQITDLITPIYSYVAAQHTIYFAYTLVTTPGQTSNAWNYDIRLHYGFGGYLNTGCTGPVHDNGFALPQDVTGTPTTYYFTVTGVDFPPGTNFLIRLKLNVPNFLPPITATQFRIASEAVLAPEGAALPVRFTSLEAKSVSNGVNITWNIAAEENVFGYDVEKSTDGIDYVKIGFLSATGKSTYQFLDSKPAQGGAVYYRIKFIDNDGKYAYSTIAVLKGGKVVIALNAFPIPTTSGITIHHGTAFAGSKINISTADGRLVRAVVPATGTQETKIDLSAIKAGMYMVRFEDGKGQSGTLKIIKQ